MLICKTEMKHRVFSLAAALLLLSLAACAPAENPGPSSLLLYRDFSALSFTREGKTLTLGDENPGVLLVLYWASWCPACERSVSRYDELADVAKAQGAKLVLVNKLDGDKETREAAEAYIEKHGLKTENWYDESAAAYSNLGLGMIPSLLVFDAENRLMGISEGQLPTDDSLRSMIKNAARGNADRLYYFIKNNLVGNDGSIADTEGTSDLSESHGLMMLAALAQGDNALFDKLLTYVDANKTQAGLVPWIAGSHVNALVDDLRIYRAMQMQSVRSMRMQTYAEALYVGNTADGMPVDFYDSEFGIKATRFTLCYGDFEALSLLARQDERWQEVYKNALAIVEGGRISSTFPLYHSWYDYEKGEYRSEKLHMAEAMLTLLHLSLAGRLPAEALNWVRARMDEGYVFAVYTPDGRPDRYGHFESSAVYAIITSIGLSEGDLTLALKAATRMEALRVSDARSPVDGAFGNADGSGVYSFSQLMGLLAYQQLREVKL